MEEQKNILKKNVAERQRDVSALRSEIQSIKKENENKLEELKKTHKTEVDYLKNEKNELEKEIESLRNSNLELTMPKNQNQRIKYLTKVDLINIFKYY